MLKIVMEFLDTCCTVELVYEIRITLEDLTSHGASHN